MKFCNLRTELLEDGIYRHVCQRAGCGQDYVSAAPRHRALCLVQNNVPSSKAQLSNDSRTPGTFKARAAKSAPSFARKAISFATAEVRWLTAGRPMRNREQVAEIFAMCQACEFFRAGTIEGEGQCRLCGCCLRSAGGLLNKIRMATEGCPAKPPKWKPEVA